MAGKGPTELMRVSSAAAAKVRDRATHNGRTIVAEAERVIEAGVAALERTEAKTTKKAAART